MDNSIGGVPIKNYYRYANLYLQGASKLVSVSSFERENFLTSIFLIRHSIELFYKYGIYSLYLEMNHINKSEHKLRIEKDTFLLNRIHSLKDLNEVLFKLINNNKILSQLVSAKLQEILKSQVNRYDRFDSSSTMFRYPMIENMKYRFEEQILSSNIAGDISETITYIVQNYDEGKKVYIEKDEDNIFEIYEILITLISRLKELLKIISEMESIKMKKDR